MTKHITNTKEKTIYIESFTYDDYPDLLAKKQRTITKNIQEKQGIQELKASLKEKSEQKTTLKDTNKQVNQQKSNIGELNSDIAHKNQIVQSLTKAFQDKTQQKTNLLYKVEAQNLKKQVNQQKSDIDELNSDIAHKNQIVQSLTKAFQDKTQQKTDLLDKGQAQNLKKNDQNVNSKSADRPYDSHRHHRKYRRPSRERPIVASTKDLNSEGQILQQKMEEILQRNTNFNQKTDESYSSLQNKVKEDTKQYSYKVEGLKDLDTNLIDFNKRSQIDNITKDLYSKNLVSAKMLFASEAQKQSKYCTKLDSRRDAFVGNIQGEGLVKYGVNARFLGSMYLLRRSFYEKNENSPIYTDVIQSSSLKPIFEQFVPK